MTTFQKIVSLFLALGLVLGIAGVYVLSRAIERIQLDYSNGFDYYGSLDVDYLAGRIGEEFAQQGSLFASVKETLRAPDAERFEVVLTVTAYPKECTESTTAQLVLGDQTAPMEFRNGAFTGEVAAPLAFREAEYFIMLKDGGTTRSQAVTAGITKFAGGWQVFGIYGGNIGEYTQDTALHFHLNETLKLDKEQLPFGDKLVSARVYAVQDGKELFSQAMQSGVLALDHTVDMPVGMPVELYGEVVGKSGLTYRYSLYELTQMQEGSGSGGPGSNLLEIIGQDGQTLQVETVEG